MITITCILNYPDGETVTGTIEAETPGFYYPITYTGKTERLPRKYDTGTASDLELLFNMGMRRSGAIMELKRNGDYGQRAAVRS